MRLGSKHRSQIRKTATGWSSQKSFLEEAGLPFIAGTSLLSTTLESRPDLSGSGLSTGLGRAGGQYIFIAHTNSESFHFWPGLFLWTSHFHLFLYLPSWTSLFLCHSVQDQVILLTASRPLQAIPCLSSHALRPWLTTTQCSTPLMTDVSDCCLLSERFLHIWSYLHLKNIYKRSPYYTLSSYFSLKNIFWRLLYVSIVPSSSFSWLQSFSVHRWSIIYLTGLYFRMTSYVGCL